MVEVNATPGATRKQWASLICGILLFATAFIPWGMPGERPLWSWNLFGNRPWSFEVMGWKAISLKVLMIGIWTCGFATVVVSCIFRGRRAALCNFIAGVTLLTLYLIDTQAGLAPWLVFVPGLSANIYAAGAALLSALLFLVAAGSDTTVQSHAARALRLGQMASSACILACTALAAYNSVGSLSGIAGAALWSNIILGLTAGCLAMSAALLGGLDALMSRSGGYVTAIARRLLLAALLALLLRGALEPVIQNHDIRAIFGFLNNGIVLAGMSILIIEGLVGLLNARPAAERRDERVRGARMIPATIATVFIAGIGLVACVRSFASPHVDKLDTASNSPATALTNDQDWTQWCGSDGRNMVSDATGLPATFEQATDEKSSGLANVKWVAPLGARTLGSPVISGGKVLVGGTLLPKGSREPIAVLWCFNEADGVLLWRMASPGIRNQYMEGSTFGICATPTLEGDRAYLVGHLGDVLCLNTKGRAGGIEGLMPNEEGYFAWNRTRTKSEIAPDGSHILEYTPGIPATLGALDAAIVWRFDMMEQTRCWPFNALNAGILIRGNYLYVATCSTISGFDDGSAKPIRDWKKKYGAAAYDSPSLIVLDKTTGTLVARETAGIFNETFHGAHASPAFGEVNGRTLLFYGGGNGTCYAFDPEFSPGADGKPGELKLVWKLDCLAPASYGSDYKLEGLKTAETIATPVFFKNRIYTSIGNDLHDSGVAAKQGRLICIDATQQGDIARTGRIWSFDQIRSTCSTVAIADGLLYTADASGVIYCLDADTGEVHWTHKTVPVWNSPLIADGKVYIGTCGNGLLVFAHSKDKKLLASNLPGDEIVASPATAHGVLFVATQKRLYALKEGVTGDLVKWSSDVIPVAKTEAR